MNSLLLSNFILFSFHQVKLDEKCKIKKKLKIPVMRSKNQISIPKVKKRKENFQLL